MDTVDELLSEREAARRAGVTSHTIMLWERIGWLHPEEVIVQGRSRFRIHSTELDRVVNEEPRIDARLVWGNEGG
jgi:MerR-like DNA binding protein